MIPSIKHWPQYILPNYCLSCKASSNSKLALCQRCIDELPWHTTAQCRICAINLSSNGICGQCLQHPPSFERIIAPLSYQTPVDCFISRLKFSKQLIYSQIMATLLAKHLIKHLDNKPEALIPIPLHPKRLRERGFNQSSEIAKLLKKQLTLPLDQHLLQRHKHTQPQTQLNAKERIKNLNQAFSLAKANTYQHIALIDDVVTTGNTIKQASNLLKKYGVKRIEVWCIARAIA